MMKRILTAVLLLFCLTASADEGMWMIHDLSSPLMKNMRKAGLRLKADEIYNEADGGLAGAIVSMEFGCTGSIVSDQGLVITNHHCAYADVHALSTPEKNYLEDGFWAHSMAEEIPIKGKTMLFLEKVLDVTDEVYAEYDQAKAEGRPLGGRKLSYVMEKRYAEQTGLEAILSSMWSGEKYYMALYKVYRDIRLVAAPPVSIAAYGGDIDNWEWPQQKCDFAMYRIYTAPDGSPAAYSEENVPLKPRTVLKVSTKGVKPGDFTMVIGFPGRTDRYSSSAKVNFKENVSLPLLTKIRGDQMEIISKWMNRDEQIRLKYANNFFSLSNVQENQAGEKQCYTRFGVVNEKKELEKVLDPQLLAKLDAKYADVSAIEKNMITFRETLVRGTRLALVSTRINSARRAPNSARIDQIRKSTAAEYAGMDLRLEKDLFDYNVATFYEGVDSEFWGPFQKELYEKFEGDAYGVSSYLWKNSWLTDPAKVEEFLKTESLEGWTEDPMMRFFRDVTIGDFNSRLDRIQGPETMSSLGRDYTHALYAYRKGAGIPQYPDANSTMRITYGKVGGYQPRDGVDLSWQTTVEGVLEKEDPQNYDFHLFPDWKALLEANRTLPADFLSDNDITGGNSGSPVMNARGEVVGLAFDGNKESLASESSYTEGYNKCINVDIRYVIFTLDKYAGMKHILEEMGVVE